MNRIAHFSLCLASMCLVMFMAQDMALAEDEDLTSSVYLVFDPETGEFVEVNDPNRILQTHNALDPADAALADASSDSRSAQAPTPPLSVGVAIVAALLAAIIVWGRVSKTRSSGGGQRQDS